MMWRCIKCDHLHECNPIVCADCGHTILKRDRTSNRADVTASASVSDAITAAVADAKNANPDDLQPLPEVINPDALDSLMQADRGPEGEIQFQYDGFEVVVRSSGAVGIEPTDDE